MKHALIITAALVLAAPTWAASPGPTPLPYSGIPDAVHCGTVACQVHVDGFFLSNGWVGIKIVENDPPQVGDDTFASGMTKHMKWDLVRGAHEANPQHMIYFSVTDVTPTISCNPHVCDVNAVVELQDVAD